MQFEQCLPVPFIEFLDQPAACRVRQGTKDQIDIHTDL